MVNFDFQVRFSDMIKNRNNVFFVPVNNIDNSIKNNLKTDG